MFVLKLSDIQIMLFKKLHKTTFLDCILFGKMFKNPGYNIQIVNQFICMIEPS